MRVANKVWINEKMVNKLILLFIFAVSYRLDVAAQERAEAPTFIDGDFWQYRVVEHGEYMKTERELNGIYEIAYSNGQFKAFKLETNQKNELRSGESVLTGLIGQTALQHLQFPLFKGKSWTTDYTFRPRRREVDRSVRVVTKVTDFAEVTISAGTFKAFKLEREARFKNVDHWIFVYYWSPQTTSVVKYQMEVLKGDEAGNKREIELIKFGSTR
jgi:hypothetical protein